ncbi:miraculin-like [Henckelia pumila]|uniref:miraculin-like n=1 Tax=Henckelia pumila TaxID=405737 RepID=UPI003C6E0E4D
MKNYLPSFITLLMLVRSGEFRLYDTGMKPLEADIPYYLVPVRTNDGGGITTIETNSTCNVVRLSIDDLPSDAVILNHDKPQDYLNWIVENLDLNIKFEPNNAGLCKNPISNVLQAAQSDQVTGQNFITLGGVQGNPGCGTIPYWFKIKQIFGEYSYKIVYCPDVCDLVTVICRDVGVYDQYAAFRRLVLTDGDPFIFRFHKKNPC